MFINEALKGILMRVAVLADCHIDHGVHGKWNTGAWKRACQKISKMNVDLVVIAGDFFQRGNPSGEAISVAVDGLRFLTDTEHGAGAEVIYLQGNHEWSGVNVSKRHRPASSSLDGITGVTVVSEPCAFPVDELWLTALPWPIPEDASSGVERHEGLMAKLADMSCEVDGPRLAVAHASVSGVGHPVPRGSEMDLAAQTNEWTIPLAEIDMPDAWSHVCLGHIHKRQSLSDTCGYVGSLEAFSFADEGQRKGFSVMEWDDRSSGWSESFIDVGVRNFKTLSSAEAANGEYQDLPEGTFVRVKFEADDHISRDEIDLGAIKKAGLRFSGLMRPSAGSKDEGEDNKVYPEVDVNAVIKPKSKLVDWSTQKRGYNKKESDIILGRGKVYYEWDDDEET